MNGGAKFQFENCHFKETKKQIPTTGYHHGNKLVFLKNCKVNPVSMPIGISELIEEPLSWDHFKGSNDSIFIEKLNMSKCTCVMQIILSLKNVRKKSLFKNRNNHILKR